MRITIATVLLFLTFLSFGQQNELRTFWGNFSNYNLYLLDYTWELLEESQIKITNASYAYPADTYIKKKDSLLNFKDKYIQFLETNINNSDVFARATEVSPFIDKTLKFLSEEVETLIQICEGKTVEGKNSSESYSEVLVKYYAIKREFASISKQIGDDFPMLGSIDHDMVKSNEIPQFDFSYSPGKSDNILHLDTSIVPLGEPVNGNLFDVRMQVGLWKDCVNDNEFKYFVYIQLDEANSWVSNTKPELATRLCDIQYQIHIIACNNIDAYLTQLDTKEKCEMKETAYNELVAKHYKEIGTMWGLFQTELATAEDWETVIAKWEKQLSISNN